MSRASAPHQLLGSTLEKNADPTLSAAPLFGILPAPSASLKFYNLIYRNIKENNG